MANEPQITVVGNLTADVELRSTQAGKSVANGTIASTPRSFNRQTNEWDDGETLFLRFSVWNEYAEHVAATLGKGNQVIALGFLKQRNFQDKEGNNRTSIELEVSEIGPALRFATAQIVRATKGQGGGQQQVQQGAPQQYGPPQGQQYGPPQGQQAPQQQMPPQQNYPAQQQPMQAPPQQGQYIDPNAPF